MLKPMFQGLVLLCMVGTKIVQAQSNSSTLIWPSLEDASINVSVDKPVYYAGDTIYLSLRLIDSTTAVKVTPMLTIEGTTFKSTGINTYMAVIPQTVTPESYRVCLKVLDARGQRFFYETNCFVNVEEYQAVEQVNDYVRMGPEAGSKNPRTAVTLDRGQIQNLRVIFERDSIGERMGPQFVTIRTTVQSPDKIAVQTFERRVLTFRSCGNNSNRNRVMFTQYRAAYGAYAVIRLEELEQVHLQLDSLPNWAVIKVNVQPDYTIKIGAYDRFNSVTHYYRVKGPRIETKFVIAFPKILYDTQAQDTMEYGKTSAMMRFYYVNTISGHRFPINLGVGTFGVNSPIDVGVGQGGFAASIFLDVVELIRKFGVQFGMKVNAGLELTPFFPIKRRSRILLNAQVGFSI
ncbi:MAG: hypothetical protein SCK70_04525 [bacterium]|nr:hypothetical protein [bacterium]